MRHVAVACALACLLASATASGSTPALSGAPSTSVSAKEGRGRALVAISARNRIGHGAGKRRAFLLGRRRIGHRAASSASGRARAFRFVARFSGRIAAIAVYVAGHNRARRLSAGLYSNHHGRPAIRLTSGSLERRPTGHVWSRIAVHPRVVHAGRSYWIAVLARGGSLPFRDRRGHNCTSEASRRRHLAALPSKWGRGRLRRGCQISAYAVGRKKKFAKRPAKRTGHSNGGTRSTGGSGGSGSRIIPGIPPSPPTRPARPKCTTIVSSMPALSSAVAHASGGTVVCIAPGSYSGLSLSGAHGSDVTVESEPGLDPNGRGKVTIGLSSTLTDGFGNAVAANIAPNSNHLVLLDLYLTNELSIAHGSSDITIEHNDFTQIGNGGGMMVNFATSNCRAPNAPSWSGCEPEGVVSNITIAGNNFHGITGDGADVLHTNNFRNMRVTANEISGAVENGNHVDCLQNVYGGTGLTFDHNYEHDNECQGFFVKDGDTTNITFDDNLFVRDSLPATNGGSSDSSTQVYNTTNLVVRNNTIWDEKGLTLRCVSSSVSCTATASNNLLWVFNNGNRGDGTLFALGGGLNIFNTGSGFSTGGPTDHVNARPGFMCGSQCGTGTRAGDDYRLASQLSQIGIDWAPAQYTYGPTS
jgi:hypothetical protein